MMSDRSYTSPRNELENCCDSIAKLSSEWAGTVEERELWWDNCYGVWATRQYRKTYSDLFGTWAPLRGRSVRMKIGRLRQALAPSRWEKEKTCTPPLPSDAVVIPLEAHSGVVCVSAKLGTVLKIKYGDSVSDIDREANAWSVARQAGLDSHVPEFISGGSTGDNEKWMIGQFARNSSPIAYPLGYSTRVKWRPLLVNQVYPFMEKIYSSSRVSLISFRDRFENIISESENISDNTIGILFYELINRWKNDLWKVQTIDALVHGDFKLKHVHYDGDTWKIIDWGTSSREDVIRERFSFLFYINTLSNEELLWWDWIKGGCEFSDLDPLIQRTVRDFANWRAAHLCTDASLEEARWHIRASLLYWICKNLGSLSDHDDIDLTLTSSFKAYGVPVNNAVAQLRYLLS